MFIICMVLNHIQRGKDRAHELAKLDKDQAERDKVRAHEMAKIEKILEKAELSDNMADVIKSMMEAKDQVVRHIGSLDSESVKSCQ